MSQALLGLAFLVASASAVPCGRTLADGLDRYVGVYGHGPAGSDAVVAVTARDGALLLHPALWSGPMVLDRVAADSFVVAEHPRFGAAFVRDEAGCVVAARVRGLRPDGLYGRLDPAAPRPIQLLAAGRPREAARAYVRLDPTGTERFVGVARMYLGNAPTRPDRGAAFLAELARLRPAVPAVHAALGDALVMAGRREDARRAYERALALDTTEATSTAALERLGVRRSSKTAGWRLPFDVGALLAPVRPAEVDTVWARWARRDLSPRAVEVVARHRVDLDGVPAEARVLAHRVHGQRHYGVVVVPDGAAPGSLPVLVEAKGVSPSFFPLDVPGGLTSPRVLGPDRGRVVYVAPGYRGERVVVGADTLTSEGDRSDAWDGATDDLLAFLRAATAATPEADAERVCVFGRSRGGTVALLAGIREPQIDCVVAWAAPTDWFTHMDLDGWTQRELVEDGLRHRAAPGETGGQFIHYFLSGALAGRRDLPETRRHLIASSPLYFAGRTPLAQAHWGVEDSIVPVANGRSFGARHRAVGRPSRCLDVRLHPDAGHDQDRQRAPAESRAFLVEVLWGDPGRSAGCRP